MSLEASAQDAVKDALNGFAIETIDFAALAGQSPPPRRWVIRDWLPRGTVTLLSGRGGVGKSLLAQQIATSIAAGRDWLGDVPEAGSVLGLFCEDDHDELWRRQTDICRGFNLDMRDATDLFLDARAGKPNSLTYSDPLTGILDTPLVGEIRQKLGEMPEPRLLILDNVAQMFQAGSGGESDRGLVTAFCNRLTRIALDFDIALLLLAHPAKADGSEYSGSTAWDAAVRSRLFLGRETDDPNSRVVLKRAKANYAALGGDVAFAWEQGAFIRADGGMSAFDQAATGTRQRDAEEAVGRALAWLTERTISASHNTRAGNYLPKLMRTHGLAEGMSVAELGEALTRMVGDMRLEVDAFLWKTGNRNRVQGLSLRTGS